MRSFWLAALATFIGASFSASAESETGRYTVIIDPSNPKGIWRLDSYNGAVSRCETADIKIAPICSPWSDIGTDAALYQYDPTTKKIVPINDAARKAEAAKVNH